MSFDSWENWNADPDEQFGITAESLGNVEETDAEVLAAQAAETFGNLGPEPVESAEVQETSVPH